MNRIALLFAVVVGLAACDRPADPAAPVLSSGASPNAPFEITYVKTETGPGTAQWTGSVTGSAIGDLRTAVESLRVTGTIWHIATRWQVVAGTRSFEAELDGTVNTTTGGLLLTGRVVSGIFTGARVYCEGQLTGIDATTGGTVFEGSLTIMSGSAD